MEGTRIDLRQTLVLDNNGRTARVQMPDGNVAHFYRDQETTNQFLENFPPGRPVDGRIGDEIICHRLGDRFGLMEIRKRSA